MGYTFPQITATTLKELLPNASFEILDLMIKMMSINPSD